MPDRRYFPFDDNRAAPPPWATQDDFPTFEREADGLLWNRRLGLTSAEQALGLGHDAPPPTTLPMRDADEVGRQPVLYQAPGTPQPQPPQPALRRVPSEPAHGPSNIGFRTERGLQAISPSPQKSLQFFKKYPGALLDTSDFVDEKFGATRNREGKLVNGTNLPREVIGGFVLDTLEGAKAEDFERFKKFIDRSAPITPEDAAWLASTMRRRGGVEAERAARQIEDASRRLEARKPKAPKRLGQ